MTNAKHTIAPWKLCSNEQGQNFQIIGADSLPVCVMSTAKSSSLANWFSNARLIAAAPELLEALEDCERNMIISTQADMARLDRIRAAIAKARGE